VVFALKTIGKIRSLSLIFLIICILYDEWPHWYGKGRFDRVRGDFGGFLSKKVLRCVYGSPRYINQEFQDINQKFSDLSKI
jgi:hypothetical protein